MKTAVPADAEHAQKAAAEPARSRPRQRVQQAATPAGHLTQLAAMMDNSPRVQELMQLRDDLQRSRRVKPATQLNYEIPVNDDSRLEHETDAMGAKANLAAGAAQVDDGGLQKMDIAPSSGALQRVAFTNKQVADAMKVRAKAFYDAPYKVIIPWDTEWEEGHANCHGFTVTGGTDAFIQGEEFLANLHENDERKIVVFVEGGSIQHSGVLVGGSLQHLLIGVGVLKSQIGSNLMGYEGRYTIPDEREELDAYLQIQSDADNSQEQVSGMVNVIAEALSDERVQDQEAANKLINELYDFRDAVPEMDAEERNQKMKAFEKRVAPYRK